jgi:hypothetical protein
LKCSATARAAQDLRGLSAISGVNRLVTLLAIGTPQLLSIKSAANFAAETDHPGTSLDADQYVPIHASK